MTETEPSPIVPADIVSLADYERHARQRLPVPVWAYVAGASADGITKLRNRQVWDEIRLQGRVLADMRGASTGLSLFGMDLPMPLVLAPVASHKLAHPDGELATVLGSGAVGACMTVSTQANFSLEEIARAARAPVWFQLYMQRERDDTLQLVRRAEAAGYRAIMVTCDAPVNGVRNEEQRAGFRLPPGVEPVNLRGMVQHAATVRAGESPVFGGLLDHAPNWTDIQWLRTQTSLPLLLKGILAPADAVRAIELGIDGIVVSNHGGRTLDTLPSTIEALPSIAEATGERIPVLLDGGIRRGTDIVKALAMGAKAVMVGEPQLHALAVAGPVGVAHMLSILRAELEVAMALTGFKSIPAINRTAISDTG